MSLTDRLRDKRNQMLMSGRFQQWAARFPLTRPIARRRAQKLFDICAGFVYSQILLACVRLRLIEILADNPQTVVALSQRLGLTVEATQRLLRAAVALELVEHRPEERYAPGPLGAALLGSPGLAAMVEHHSMLYEDLSDPVALLQNQNRGSTALAQQWPYAVGDKPGSLPDNRISAYTELMAATQPMISAQVLETYPFESKGHKTLLDIGGGNGSFLVAIARQTRHLNLILFDLPAVAEQARIKFEHEQLSHRATAIGGDMLKDRLPDGADIVSLVRIIHDHDDAAALEILRAAKRALPADGTLLIAEPLADTRGSETVGDAYFGFYLLAMGSGRPRSSEELRDLLEQAGFKNFRRLPTDMPMLTSVILATPSAH